MIEEEKNGPKDPQIYFLKTPPKYPIKYLKHNYYKKTLITRIIIQFADIQSLMHRSQHNNSQLSDMTS